MSFYLIPTYTSAKTAKRAPFIVGCHYRDGFPKSSKQGVHELCIRKSGGRGLVLTGWDDRKNRPSPWAALAFNTWEGKTDGQNAFFFLFLFPCHQAPQRSLGDFQRKLSAVLLRIG